MARAYRRHRKTRWWKDAILTCCFLFLLVLIAARLQGGGGDPVSGPFRVVDGDTLAVGGQRLRLAGIDAPELDQTCERDGRTWPCGAQAKQLLETLIASGIAECHGSEPDRYGRLLVSCIADGQTVNGAMVRGGMALTTGVVTYRREQMQAQAQRAGVWAGPFDTPAEWRRQRKIEEQGSGWPDALKDVLSLRWL